MVDAARLAIEHLRKIGKAGARIGIEPAFLPSDARDLLASGLEGAHFVDADGHVRSRGRLKFRGSRAIVGG